MSTKLNSYAPSGEPLLYSKSLGEKEIGFTDKRIIFIGLSSNVVMIPFSKITAIVLSTLTPQLNVCTGVLDEYSLNIETPDHKSATDLFLRLSERVK